MSFDAPYHVSGLSPVNHVVVKVKDGQDAGYQPSSSGLYVPDTEGSKVPSFGVVVYPPAVVTVPEHQPIAALMNVTGAVVHFSTRRSYDYLPVEEAGVKYLIVPLDAVQLVDLPEIS